MVKLSKFINSYTVWIVIVLWQIDLSILWIRFVSWDLNRTVVVGWGWDPWFLLRNSYFFDPYFFFALGYALLYLFDKPLNTRLTLIHLALMLIDVFLIFPFTEMLGYYIFILPLVLFFFGMYGVPGGNKSGANSPVSTFPQDFLSL